MKKLLKLIMGNSISTSSKISKEIERFANEFVTNGTVIKSEMFTQDVNILLMGLKEHAQFLRSDYSKVYCLKTKRSVNVYVEFFEKGALVCQFNFTSKLDYKGRACKILKLGTMLPNFDKINLL